MWCAVQFGYFQLLGVVILYTFTVCVYSHRLHLRLDGIYEYMNERKLINLYMVHKDLHTKPCVFTAPDAQSSYL